MSLHMHKKLSPSMGKEHMHLYGMEQDICGSYTEVSDHKPLSRGDNRHHSSAAYKHGVHNRAMSGTSSHMPNLDNKEPLSSSSHTCTT